MEKIRAGSGRPFTIFQKWRGVIPKTAFKAIKKVLLSIFFEFRK
jgi:hypothetical protein